MEKAASITDMKELRSRFLRYVFMNMTSMIGYSIYILADTFFISKGLGADGLAALNIALPVYYVIAGVQMMLAIGGASRFIVYRTQGRQADCDSVYSQVMEVGLVFGLICSVLSFFVPGPISAFLGAEGVVYEMTTTYNQVIMLFAPAFVINQIRNTFVKNDDNPKIAMYAMLAGSLFNIIFDYVFIFICGLGILGAVLATGFSPVMGLLVMILHNKRQTFHFRWTKPKAKLFRSVITLGVPSMINEFASAIVMVAFNYELLALTGDVGVAAYGVILNIYLVILYLFNGIAQGAQPLLGESFSRGQKMEHKKVYQWAIIVSLILSAVVYLLLWLFKTEAVAVFNSEGNMVMQALAEEGILLYFAAMPFAGFNIITTMNFVSMQKGLPGQLITLLRGLLLMVPVVLVLAAAAGVTGVWLALPVTEALTAVVAVILLKRTKA